MHHYFVSYIGFMFDDGIRYCDTNLVLNHKIKSQNVENLYPLLINTKTIIFKGVCILSINYLGEFEEE